MDTKAQVDTTEYLASHALAPTSTLFGNWWFRDDSGRLLNIQSPYSTAVRRLAAGQTFTLLP